MRKFTFSVALASLSLAAPAAAQTAGMQVVDTNGGAVGAVTAVKGGLITVKTNKHEVALPRTSFTLHEGKLLFGMTQAQLNAEAEKAQAQANAAIAPGATVKGSGGAVLGTIDAIDAEFVTLKLESGELVRLPRSGVAASNGEVVAGVTAEQLRAQVAPSTGGK
jgi:preprotein translocase subunit YajC